MFKKRKAKNFFSATLCLCLCFNTNQLFFIPMLPWGIVPMSSLPIGWGGGYMGIANQMLLVQPFCSERWETAFLNYGNDFCLFPFIFLHHHLHILFCTIISSPCAFCSFIFTWLSCGLLCFWHSGVWICGFYFFLCVNSHIYNFFLYIWTELPGHATKFLQLVIFIARWPFLQWSHSVLAIDVAQTDLEGRQCAASYAVPPRGPLCLWKTLDSEGRLLG